MDKCTKLTHSLTSLRRCQFCGEPAGKEKEICGFCRSNLPWNTACCLRCGVALPSATESCGSCLKKPPPVDQTLSLCRYEAGAKKLIQSLKFHAHHPAARLMGELLADRIQSLRDLPEMIIPVPLHRSRYVERGFNQALEIARPISKKLGIPIGFGLAKRNRNTAPQSGLDARERRKNLKNAFSVKKQRLPQSIVIVDDVITTGSTVNELAQTLRRHGVKQVEAWSFARA